MGLHLRVCVCVCVCNYVYARELMLARGYTKSLWHSFVGCILKQKHIPNCSSPPGEGYVFPSVLLLSSPPLLCLPSPRIVSCCLCFVYVLQFYCVYVFVVCCSCLLCVFCFLLLLYVVWLVLVLCVVALFCLVHFVFSSFLIIMLLCIIIFLCFVVCCHGEIPHIAFSLTNVFGVFFIFFGGVENRKEGVRRAGGPRETQNLHHGGEEQLGICFCFRMHPIKLCHKLFV